MLRLFYKGEEERVVWKTRVKMDKRRIKKLLRKIKEWGLGPVEYRRDKRDYMKKSKEADCDGFHFDRQYSRPVYYDRYDSCGTLDSHYFLQDLYMAREIRKNAPKEHYDIGSRVDGFVSHLLSFRDSVAMIDIRPLPFDIPGLRFVQGDATGLETIQDGTIESLSSLHAVEHFGLGRYGDPVDPTAWKKALLSMCRVLRPGGGIIHIRTCGEPKPAAF